MVQHEDDQADRQGEKLEQEAGPYQHQLRRPGAAESLREREEVGGRAFDRPEPTGVAALVGKEAIEKIAEAFTYPLSREDFLACAGDESFEFRRGRPLSLRAVMMQATASSFESREALVHALLSALDERSGRERRGS